MMMLKKNTTVALIIVILLASAAHATIMAVDLGSEYVKVAAPRGTTIDICLNEQSHRKTDQFIGFRGAERFFGCDAKNFAARFPDNMIPAISRIVGIAFNDTQVTREWLREAAYFTYGIEMNALKGTINVTIPVEGSERPLSFSAEELLGMYFTYIKRQVEKDVGTPVRDAVVSVPKYFSSRQRQAVIDAAAVAGVRVLSLINPTTAVALQLGMQNRGFGNDTKNILIYDMGALKTEAAVYRYTPPAHGAKSGESLGTITLMGGIASDPSLGGRSFDACLARMFEDEYVARTKQSRVMVGSTIAERKAVVSLMRAANKAKEILSANKDTQVTVEGITPDKDFSTRVTRKGFEEQCAELFQRAVTVRDAAIEAGGVAISDLDRFEVVGGGLRVPHVLERLARGYKKGVVDRTLNSDESVAVGAAYNAVALSGHFRLKGFKVQDRLTQSVTFVVSASPPSDNGGVVQTAAKQRELFQRGQTVLPSRMSLHLNRTTDFTVQLFEEGRAMSSTTVSGVSNALKNVGFGDADAMDRNISHVIRVDVRASEGGLAFIEGAEITISYLVNVSHKIRVRVNQSDGTANATSDNETSKGEETQPESEGEEDVISDEEPTVVNAKPTTASTPKASPSSKSNAPPAYKTVTQVQLERKVRSFPLTLDTNFTFPFPMGRSEALASRNVLRSWNLRDDAIHARSAAKNELEEYLIWCRGEGFASSSEAASIVSAADMETALKKLQDVQEWLDERGDADDVTTEDLKEKLRIARIAVRTALRQKEGDEKDEVKSSAPSAPSSSTTTNEDVEEVSSTDEMSAETTADGGDEDSDTAIADEL